MTAVRFRKGDFVFFRDRRPFLAAPGASYNAARAKAGLRHVIGGGTGRADNAHDGFWNGWRMVRMRAAACNDINGERSPRPGAPPPGGPEPAEMAHCDALAAIHKASFPRRQAWAVDAFALQLILPGVFGLIDPCGGLILVRAVEDEAEVLTLAVIPAMRRRGIAAALLRQAIMEAAGRGVTSLFLEVSTRNTGAQALYRRFGFTEVGRRRRYYPDGSDALVLRMQLGGLGPGPKA